MQTTRLIRCLVPLALAVVAIAAPDRLAAQATDPAGGTTTYRLTADGLEKFSSATRELAALARQDPSAVAFTDGGVPPAAARVFAASGMSFDEWALFVGAMFEAASAQYVIANNPEAAADMQMSGITKANVSFIEKNQEAIDALGPHIKALQDAGEDS